MQSRLNYLTGLVTELSRVAAVGFTLPQRSQLSVTGSSILAPVSNAKGRGNLFSKPGTLAVRRVVYGQGPIPQTYKSQVTSHKKEASSAQWAQFSVSNTILQMS